MTAAKPNFDTDGRNWPHREASRFVAAADMTFHVQTLGEGPDIVLLHGTGASTHSFRALMTCLAPDYRVTAFDLPGHGFTDTPLFTRMTLPGVSQACAALLTELGLARPACVVGHSAGTAVAMRMALDGAVVPGCLVGFNASLKPFAGAAQPIFSTMAKALFVNPLTPRVFAATASQRRVRALIEGTGSKLDREGLSYYRALFRSPGHCSGALAMMAGWDLVPLNREMPKLKVPITLVAAALDKTIAPEQQTLSARSIPGARVVRMPNLGHLAHEEAPDAAARIVRQTIAATVPAATVPAATVPSAEA